MRTEHQVHYENRVRASRQGQRLAVDGRAVGQDELHELLRWRVAQPTVRVDRRSLFQKVRAYYCRRYIAYSSVNRDVCRPKYATEIPRFDRTDFPVDNPRLKLTGRASVPTYVGN